MSSSMCPCPYYYMSMGFDSSHPFYTADQFHSVVYKTALRMLWMQTGGLLSMLFEYLVAIPPCKQSCY